MLGQALKDSLDEFYQVPRGDDIIRVLLDGGRSMLCLTLEPKIRGRGRQEEEIRRRKKN